MLHRYLSGLSMVPLGPVQRGFSPDSQTERIAALCSHRQQQWSCSQSVCQLSAGAHGLTLRYSGQIAPTGQKIKKQAKQQLMRFFRIYISPEITIIFQRKRQKNPLSFPYDFGEHPTSSCDGNLNCEVAFRESCHSGLIQRRTRNFRPANSFCIIKVDSKTFKVLKVLRLRLKPTADAAGDRPPSR